MFLNARSLMALLIAILGCRASVADDAHDSRRPRDFIILFTFGYGGDDLLPKDRETFEKVAEKVKQAHFTAIMGTYEPWKVEICKKHGLKFVVNLLSDEHHVYKNIEGAKALCEKLRGNESIWGYHLYSDMNYKTVKGRNRDMANVHEWDPTHPTYVGSYKLSGNGRLENPDVHSYYDFHWQRGPHLNFPHLLSASKIATDKDCYFYRWIRVSPGRPGHPDRARYTVNTSIACGLKGVFWFIGGEMMDRGKWEWNQYGKDIAQINSQVLPLGAELMKLGNPTAIYSTTTSLTSKGREKAENDSPVPSPLTAIPDGHWVQVTAGEAVLGLYQDADKRDAIFVANHNAHGEQAMKLTFREAVESASKFSREKSEWETLKITNNSVEFKLANAHGELLRIER